MKTILLKIILILSLGLMFTQVRAQDKKDGKEVIIIEKTIDEDGNVISKSIKRNQGDISDEELERMLEDDSNVPHLRSFDWEGMGFPEDFFGNFFQPQSTPSKPRLGVQINESQGYADVTHVQRGSGADRADIRAGDRILVVRGESVANVADIARALDGKQRGDKVKLIILRDEQELEKEVALGVGSSNSILQFPMDMDLQFFGDEGKRSAIMDSLFNQMRNFNFDGFDFDGFNMDRFLENRRNEGATELAERPQLGLLIDQEGNDVIVSDVIENGASEKAGIQKGDIIEKFDDNIIGSFRELKAMMNTKNRGDEVIITVRRGANSVDVVVGL